MLNRLYQEAYLVDSQAADAVWEEWWSGDLTDFFAAVAWWAILMVNLDNSEDFGHGTSMDSDFYD